MRLPFTEQQFLDLFGAYNTALWPFLALLWLASLWVALDLMRGRPRPVAISLVAAALWIWSGLVYHALYFARINPAAWLFAALFVIEGAAFLWWGVVRRELTFDWSRTLRHGLAGIFLVYAQVYPFLVLLAGVRFPRAPAAGVPCPTTIFTVGLLLAATPRPRSLSLVPVFWAIVGGSAAWLLGMTPDLMLWVAVPCLAAYAWAPRRRERPSSAGHSAT